MAEFIKKFANPAAADQYAIKDIPFITSIGATGPQNLVCNEENKKISVDGQGNISIIDNISLINFCTKDLDISDEHYLQAADGMTWREWMSSKYNTDGFSIRTSYGKDRISTGHHILDDYILDGQYYSITPYADDLIIANAEYHCG